MKLQGIDFRVWSKQEKRYLSNPFLMRRMPIIDCLGEINTEAICGEYSFVENKNNESIFTRFLRFLKRFQKTRIIAPSNFAKSFTHIENNLVENNMELELELWSGFRDKNGKKIYKGDIVHIKPNDLEDWIDFIDFRKDKGYFLGVDGYGYEDDWLDDDFCEGCCQVVGNIHQNPELLGGEE